MPQAKMLRRYPSPTKPWNVSMKIGAGELAAKAHRLPRSPVHGTKNANKIMNSNILGPSTMMLPIRTRTAPKMALQTRVSHGKGENSLPVRKFEGDIPKIPPTRVCKSRKSKDVAIAKLLTTHSPKIKDVSQAVKHGATDVTKKNQNAQAESTTIKTESEEPQGTNITDEFEPEDILSTKVRNGRRWYLVKWVGKPSCEDSWQRKEHLYYSQTIINKFHSSRKDKP